MSIADICNVCGDPGYHGHFAWLVIAGDDMNYAPSGGSWDLGGPNVTNENTTAGDKIVDHETGVFKEFAARKGWDEAKRALRDDQLVFQSFEDVMSSIYDEAYDLLVEKQRGYGSKNIEQLGIHGVFSRLAYDKVERIKKFLNGTVEEGVVYLETNAEFEDAFEDAALDLMNYAAILIALKRGLWGKPLQEELELERGY